MNREQIAALIPHTGPMCLLDEAITWDASHIHCRSSSHLAEQNPLHRRGQLAAVNLVEYAAQAAALHSGLQRQDAGDVRGGVLAGLRDVRLAPGDMQQIDEPLEIHAHREISSPLGMIYRFKVGTTTDVLASGQVTIIMA